MRRFNCDADVQKHFSLQAEFGSRPDPPADLWERIESAQRDAKKIPATKRYPLRQPDLASFVFPEIGSETKTHPIRVVERLSAVPDVRPTAPKTHKLKRAFSNDISNEKGFS